jgi:hypothetical protein
MSGEQNEKDRVHSDPDYIGIKRFQNSLEALLQRYPEGCPDHIVASALMITEEEAEAIYAEIVKKLKGLIEP